MTLQEEKRSSCEIVPDTYTHLIFASKLAMLKIRDRKFKERAVWKIIKVSFSTFLGCRFYRFCSSQSINPETSVAYQRTLVNLFNHINHFRNFLEVDIEVSSNEHSLTAAHLHILPRFSYRGLEGETRRTDSISGNGKDNSYLSIDVRLELTYVDSVCTTSRKMKATLWASDDRMTSIFTWVEDWQVPSALDAAQKHIYKCICDSLSFVGVKGKNVKT